MSILGKKSEFRVLDNLICKYLQSEMGFKEFFNLGVFWASLEFLEFI
jgi:hypothetical protein